MYVYFVFVIDYDGGKYGIGFFIKEIFVSLKIMIFFGWEEVCVLIMVEFDNYIYCCIYLFFIEEDCMVLLEFIKDFVVVYKKFFFLVGDLNVEFEFVFIKYL